MDNVMEVMTQDDLKYQWFPVSSGSISFKVRAAHDAHLALTMDSQESQPMIEVFIGGWSNTKSVIRKNKQQPEKDEAQTENILNGGEYRGFWVRWDAGIIQAGREGEAIAFLSWQDPEPFPVRFVGVCTGWGASGTWKIEDGQEFSTPDKLEYVFGPVASGSLEFEYCGPHNAHICLAPSPAESNPMHEIILGGWDNTKSVIRHCRQEPDKVTIPTPRLMDPSRFKKFLIQWRCSRLMVRDVETNTLMMEWEVPTPFPITHFGVRTGWGARGHWRIRHFSGKRGLK